LKKGKNGRQTDDKSQIQLLVWWMLVIERQTTTIGFLNITSVPDIHFLPKLVRSYSIHGEWKNPIDLGINTGTLCQGYSNWKKSVCLHSSQEEADCY